MATYSPSKITKDGNTYNFTDATKIPLAGSNQISGDLIPATDNSVNLGDSTYGFANFYVNKLYLKGSTIFNVVDDNYICVGSATAQANGANLVLNGKNRSTSTGEFKLEARDGTYTRQLIGKPDGTLSWDGDIIPSADGAYGLGNSSCGFKDIYLKNANSKIYYSGDTVSIRSTGNGVGFILGYAALLPGSNSTWSLGSSTVKWKNAFISETVNCLTVNCQTVVQTSDYRLKEEINSISDEVLNAWENLEPKQYKYKSDLENNKDTAQIHYGWIAQDVESIIKGDRKGEVKNGLWLHEEWEEQQEVSHEETYTEEVQTKSGETETVIKTRKVIDTPYKAKGDSYGLRYTECLVVECAFLRKKLKELTARIEELKKGNNTK